jgi:hypothetical protein
MRFSGQEWQTRGALLTLPPLARPVVVVAGTNEETTHPRPLAAGTSSIRTSSNGSRGPPKSRILRRTAIVKEIQGERGREIQDLTVVLIAAAAPREGRSFADRSSKAPSPTVL